MVDLNKLINRLPKFIENEKGTKFQLVICTTSKGMWRVQYIWPPRNIKRKGWPVCESVNLTDAVKGMVIWIMANHRDLLDQSWHERTIPAS